MGLLKSEETFGVELPDGRRESWRMLVTYSTKGVDRMRLRVSRSGEAWLDEHVKVDTSAPYTPIELEREVDGEPHRLVLGWVSATRSAMRVYRDGELVGETHEEPWSDGGRLGRMAKMDAETFRSTVEGLDAESPRLPWWLRILLNVLLFVVTYLIGREFGGWAARLFQGPM